MRTRTPSSARSRLALTRLEDRTVPAVTATLLNGVLSVLGDGAGNAINLAQAQALIESVMDALGSS